MAKQGDLLAIPMSRFGPRIAQPRDYTGRAKQTPSKPPPFQAPIIIFPTVCFRSQQNHPPPPTITRHGRKQGNGGTHEAGQTNNSYGLSKPPG